MSKIRLKVTFKAEFDRFEFRIFLLIDVAYTKIKVSSVPYYLCIVRYIPFLRVVAICEIQTAPSSV